MSHTKGTSSLASISGSLNIVLEEAGSSVVGEALAQFDNGDKESRLGEWFSNMAERSLFLFGWTFTAKVFVVTFAVEAIGYACVLRGIGGVVMAYGRLLMWFFLVQLYCGRGDFVRHFS